MFLGASVKVFTSKSELRRRLCMLGISAVDYNSEEEMTLAFADLDILINTAPARLISEESAKVLSEKRVIGYHAFRNTLIPIVTIVGGSLPGLFSGALITETLFDIRGIGYISYHSMVGGDIPFTMFYLAFSSILILLGTLMSDILYAVVDPRVRLN